MNNSGDFAKNNPWVNKMVLLFSDRKSKLEKEITEILTAFGADFITDKSVSAIGGFFTVVVCYKKSEINIKKGIALMIDDTEKFKNQVLPKGIVGVCEDNNSSAIDIFKANRLPAMTCGLSHKNTVTFSSMGKKHFVLTLQREITDINGNTILPCDIKVDFEKEYSPSAVLLSLSVLCLLGFNSGDTALYSSP